MIDKILRRLGLLRRERVIEALIDLRQEVPSYGTPGYISDKQWVATMRRMEGLK